MLNNSIAELINNVYDHAKSPIDAYVFCQFFPKDRSIKIVVGDLGIGIPNSVNNYLKSIADKTISNKASLKWAIEERKSTKSMPHNKGLGLYNLHSFIKSSQSSLRILSNDVAFNAFSYA
jgi:sensor histidine kinase regulating citrate/malate metabolism